MPMYVKTTIYKCGHERTSISKSRHLPIRRYVGDRCYRCRKAYEEKKKTNTISARKRNRNG